MADSRLRILHVNAWDTGGGAAMVARNLCEAARQRGHVASLAVGRKYSSDQNVLQIPVNQDLYGRWSQFWWDRLATNAPVQPQAEGRIRQRLALGLAEPSRMLDIIAGREDFNFPGTRYLLDLPERPPDLVHAHNLHDAYFDLRELPGISHRIPTVMTLHDAWMLSGHCAHSLGCDRWTTGCGNCPDLAIPPEIRRDATRFNWQRKAQIFRASRLFVATPSQWLMDRVERSMLAPAIFNARVIPNGVDLSVFQPSDRLEARNELHLPPEARIVLFAANGVTSNPWKDMAMIRETVVRAAESLPGQPLLCLVLGEQGGEEQIGTARMVFVPYQEDPGVVARYYQASDVYIHASRADTFPTTVLEAMACSLPVVATAVGGIPEQVEHGQTGYLAGSGDHIAFAGHLIRLLSDERHRHQLGVMALARARERFDLKRQADSYLNWYAEILTAGEANSEKVRHVAPATA